MKKSKIFIFFMAFMMFIPLVKATRFDYSEFVYYDPVNRVGCSSTDYWTPYNKEIAGSNGRNLPNTCFRFIVITPNDKTGDEYIRLLLDHNIGEASTFDKYRETMDKETAGWEGDQGNVDAITLDEAKNLLKIGQWVEPTMTNPISGDSQYGLFNINALYYVNGVKTEENGFWTSDSKPLNSTDAYYITNEGQIGLSSRKDKRGIRPAITISKSRIKNDRVEIIDISTRLDRTTYAYKLANDDLSYSNKVYLQSFKFLDKDLYIYLAADGSDSHAMVYHYNGYNFSDFVEKKSISNKGTLATSNSDFVYNSYAGNFFFTGFNNFNKVASFNKQFAFNSEYSVNVPINSLVYDSVNNMYFGSSSNRVFVMDNDFKIKYSFDMPDVKIYQGKFYYKGYLYATNYQNSIESTNSSGATSQYIYVYNAKITKNGVDKNFGKLVKKILISGKYGALKSVAFYNQKLFLGYDARAYDSTNTIKFYTIDESKVIVPLNYTVDFEGNINSFNVKITSDSELKQPSDNTWSLSDDKLSVSKKFNGETSAVEVEICDNFNNCANVNFSVEDTSLPKDDTVIVSIDNKDYVIEKGKTLNDLPKEGRRYLQELLTEVPGGLEARIVSSAHKGEITLNTPINEDTEIEIMYVESSEDNGNSSGSTGGSSGGSGSENSGSTGSGSTEGSNGSSEGSQTGNGTGDSQNGNSTDSTGKDVPFTGATLPVVLILTLVFLFIIAKFEIKKYKKFYRI